MHLYYDTYDDLTDLVIITVIWLISIVVAGVVAEAKGRSVGGWIALCFLFWPAVFVIACLPDLHRQRERRRGHRDAPQTIVQVVYNNQNVPYTKAPMPTVIQHDPHGRIEPRLTWRN